MEDRFERCVMDWFDEEELPHHVYMYRRFILSVRYIVLAHMVAFSFVAFTFFIHGGSWVAGFLVAAIVLALGLYYIRKTPVHPHAAVVRQLPHRRQENTRRW
jgi:hypothetical protein